MDVFFKEDVAGGLLAGLGMAIETAQAHGVANIEYCSGVLAMARCQAFAFRLNWPELMQQAKQGLGDDVLALLESTKQIEGDK